jgi:Mrp family chromosome partitioning ATPase
VTTLATSLAASLSETGEGNVLYVDVNQQLKASAHPFRKGKPAVGISDVLGEGSRESALVSQNLYMVSLGDPSSNRVGVLPKKLANLVPEIRKSNYDYIIFDLPPVTQTSVAARVSGLMDTTVMVLESEKTQTELARQAVRLLEESNTELVAVLNKHKRYLPQNLETDL